MLKYNSILIFILYSFPFNLLMASDVPQDKIEVKEACCNLTEPSSISVLNQSGEAQPRVQDNLSPLSSPLSQTHQWSFVSTSAIFNSNPRRAPSKRGATSRRTQYDAGPLGLPSSHCFTFNNLRLSELVDPFDIGPLGGQSKSTYEFLNDKIPCSTPLVIKSWDNYHMAVNELLGAEVFSVLGLRVPRYKLFLRKDLPLSLQNICSSNDPLSLVRIAEHINISNQVLATRDLEKWQIYASFLNFYDFHENNYVQDRDKREYLLDTGGSLLYGALGHKKEDFFNFTFSFQDSSSSAIIYNMHKLKEGYRADYESILRNKNSILDLAHKFLKSIKYPLSREIISYFDKAFLRVEYLLSTSSNREKQFFDPFEKADTLTSAEVIFYIIDKGILLELKDSELNNPFKADCRKEEYVWQTARRIVQEAIPIFIADSFLKIMSCPSFDEVELHEGLLRKKRYYFLPLSNEMASSIGNYSQRSLFAYPINNNENSVFTPILNKFTIPFSQLISLEPGLNFRVMLAQSYTFSTLDNKIGQVLLRILSQNRLQCMQGNNRLLSNLTKSTFVAHVIAVLDGVLREKVINDLEISIDNSYLDKPWKFLSTKFFEAGLKNDDVKHLITNLKNLYRKVENTPVFSCPLNQSIYEILSSRFYELLEALVYSKNFYTGVDEPEIIKEVSKKIEHQPYEKITRHPSVVSNIQSAYYAFDISNLHTHFKYDISALSNIEIDSYSNQIGPRYGFIKNEFLDKTWIKYVDLNNENYVGLYFVKLLEDKVKNIAFDGKNKHMVVEKLISLKDASPKLIDDFIRIINIFCSCLMEIDEEVIESAMRIARNVPTHISAPLGSPYLTENTCLFEMLKIIDSYIEKGFEDCEFLYDIIAFNYLSPEFKEFLLNNFMKAYNGDSLNYDYIVKKRLNGFYKRNKSDINLFLEFAKKSDWKHGLYLVEFVKSIWHDSGKNLTVNHAIKLLKNIPTNEFFRFEKLFKFITKFIPYDEANFHIFKSFFKLFLDYDINVSKLKRIFRDDKIVNHIDDILREITFFCKSSNCDHNIIDSIVDIVNQNIGLIEDKSFNFYDFYSFALHAYAGSNDKEKSDLNNFIDLLKLCSAKINMDAIECPSKFKLYLALFNGDDLGNIDLDYVERVIELIDDKYKDFSSDEIYGDIYQEIEKAHMTLFNEEFRKVNLKRKNPDGTDQPPSKYQKTMDDPVE
jgi:hypothetical protein